MNKKAQFEEWGNIIILIVIVALTALLFFRLTENDRFKIEKEVKEFDEDISREALLISYLRMPVASTTLVSMASVSMTEDRKELLESAIKEKATMQDLISKSAYDTKYIDIIKMITAYEKPFLRYTMYIDIDGKVQYDLSPGSISVGKTSSAIIPSYYGGELKLIKLYLRTGDLFADVEKAR